MDKQLRLEILPQPDHLTCGPTCLQAVYRFFGDSISLNQVVDEIPQLEDGGTLAVVMACHALKRGYSATIVTSTLSARWPTRRRSSSRAVNIWTFCTWAVNFAWKI
jgi:ABC-type bacteriocin/lantibiotic exporter with double-glycine peptidase domain